MARTHSRLIRVFVAVALACGVVSVPAVQAHTPDSRCTRFHVALPNDSWFGLAARFNLSRAVLLRLNGATLSTPLFVGNRVCLGLRSSGEPSSAGASSGNDGKTTSRTTTTTTTTTTTVASGPIAPVVTIAEPVACRPIQVSWRGASPDTGLYSLQWVRVSPTGTYDFNTYTMFNVRGTSTALPDWMVAGATYAIRVFAMHPDWDGVWHSTQNVTPHSQIATFSIPNCTTTSSTTTSSTTTSSTTTTTTLPAGASTVDSGFNPNVSGYIADIWELSDGKILISGNFTSVGGITRKNLARLNADGTVDSAFPDLNFNDDVHAIAVQSNGKIFVGGRFTSAGGETRSRLARLNADGTLDSTFTLGASNQIFDLALQSDDKIVVIGEFSTILGARHYFMARLNADGTVDSGFSSTLDTTAYALAIQPDGKILVGGAFEFAGGRVRKKLARLNSDGSADTSFPDPNINSQVYAITMQSDGKILVGGFFTSVGGLPRNRLVRFNSDGTLDAGFNANIVGTLGDVSSIAVQADGKILVGGVFTSVDGTARKNFARLNSDGTLDTTYGNLDINQWVGEVRVQADGRILLGGGFTSVGGITRNRFARVS